MTEKKKDKPKEKVEPQLKDHTGPYDPDARKAYGLDVED